MEHSESVVWHGTPPGREAGTRTNADGTDERGWDSPGDDLRGSSSIGHPRDRSRERQWQEGNGWLVRQKLAGPVSSAARPPGELGIDLYTR